MGNRLNTEQAAAYLGMSPGTLQNKRYRPDLYGKGPTYYKRANLVEYDVKDLDYWQQEYVVKVETQTKGE